jgi:putative phage-type endonuclease
MIQENLNIDHVIDRLYIKYREKHEPYQMIQEIIDTLSHIFVGIHIERNYVKERIFKILDYQQQLKKLQNIPILEQRSPEWYEMRQNLITASDFAQALGEGKFGTQKQFLQKKCGYEKDTFDQNNPALKWGVKYEQVANDAYEKKNKTKMYEFGLLRHPQLHWFGASPDAISELGIMVEIKCPWKRKITGEIPRQYFYQIQGQLDVCELDECDYLECEFIEYSNRDELIQHFNDNLNEKGIIIEYDNNNTTKYVYSNIYENSLVQLLNWETKNYEKLKDKIIKITYWQLNTFSVVRVYKDKKFLEDKFTLLKEIWDKIMIYKSDRKLYDKEVAVAESKNSTYNQNPSQNYFQKMITIDTSGSAKSPSNKQPATAVTKNKDISIKGFAFIMNEDD